MRVCWVVADDFSDPFIESKILKDIGPVWGSWRTRRSWNTDNVLCHDLSSAKDLIQKDFQSTCNFYIPKKYHPDLGRPAGVRLYEGDFFGEMDHPEEIIAMHLVAGNNDLVLLLGFDITKNNTIEHTQKQKNLNYQNAFRATLNTYPEVQWVLIDHPGKLGESFGSISNITCDNFDNVLKLLHD